MARGDRLLAPELELRLNAVLAPSFEGGEALVAGYRRAATYLNEAALATDSLLWADEIAYPIVFPWRHYLEVRLKSISALLRNTSGATHSLKEVWQVTKNSLDSAGFVDPYIIEEIESVVLEFHGADPKSQAYRYAAGKSGQALIDPGTVMNLRRLLSGMRRIAGSLDGLVDEIIERRKM